MHSHSHIPVTGAKQYGFSMLEILITLVIIATALLGTAGLQVYAMRMGQSSQFRTQAVFLASDIAERMEANKSAAVSANYVLASTSTTSLAATDCATTACTSANLAAWDLSQWGIAIAGLLPQASWQICVDGNNDNACDMVSTAANPITYLIQISWVDRGADKSSHSETLSYSAKRTISN